MTDPRASGHTFKPIHDVLVVLGLAFLLLIFLLFRPSDIKVVPPEPDPSSAVDIIVDEKPLTVPDEFKKTLQGLDIAGIILVNDEAQLRLIDPNGKPIDPCGPKSKGSAGSWTCKYAATPKTFALRASGNTQLLSQCGRCRDAVGINHSCHLPTGTGNGRYDCPDPHPFRHERCDTRCENH
jgi:hypothetical protein